MQSIDMETERKTNMLEVKPKSV